MCVEGFREKRPYTRQSLPWFFLFCRWCFEDNTPRLSPRKNQTFSGGFRGVSALEPKWLSLLSFVQSAMRFAGGQVFQKANTSALSVSRMVSRYWKSLRWCGSYVSYSPCIFLFSTRLCVTWQRRPMWSKLSWPRRHPHWHGFNVSWQEFSKQKVLFNGPDSPDHSDQDSDKDGWTRLRARKLGVEWGVIFVSERNQFVIY
jgi:hypothetical protein